MQINELPRTDQSLNTTGCCARFTPGPWEGQDLHLRDLPVLRAHTMSAMHLPLNMGRVFTRVQTHIDAAGARDPEHPLVLSRDLSPWTAEHLFAVTRPVLDEEMTTLSGDFLTKVFEGPYSEVRHWHQEMQDLARAQGHEPGPVWFYYTTCPKCARAYGQNTVVGLVEV